MITRNQAKTALHAFAWTDGKAFLNAYEKAFEYRPRWDGYIGEQFELMQKDGLRFIMKWPELAAEIVIAYTVRD